MSIQLPTFLFALLFLQSITLYAQEQKTWQWVSQLGSNSWDIAGGIACNGKNNLYVTGSYFDTLVCKDKKLASAGNRDVFIASFDLKGNLKDLWSGGGKGNDQATCITLTKDNNVIIGGVITGDVSFEKITNNGVGKRLFVTSITEKGKFSWISTLTPSAEAALFHIGADAAGNLFVAGVFTDSLTSGNLTITSNGKKDIFMARLGPSGNVEKLVALGGEEDDLPSALSVSDSGKIVLAGITRKTFHTGDFEIRVQDQNQRRESVSNVFIISFTDNLTPIWKKQITGEEYCKVTAIGQDKNENIYACGSFNLSITIEDSLITSNGYSDGLLLKYGPDGKLLWVRNFGSWYYDYANHLVIDNFGGALVTGSMGDTLTIDSLTVNPLSANNSALAIQFTPQGKATWADCISGSGRNFGEGAVIDREGNLYLTGTFRDVFMKENSKLTSLGDQDVFLAKYFNCPTTRAEIFGDTLLCPGSTTQLSVKQEYNHVVWNDTIQNVNYIIAFAPGTYKVSMLNKRGCVLADTVEVTPALPSHFSLGDDTSLPIESSLLLKAPENYTGYHWQDGANDATYLAEIKQETAGTYTFWLSATDSLGCVASDTINIEFYITPGWLDLGKIQLNVFPNPVGDMLYWSVNAEKPCQFIIELVDDNGRITYYEHVKNYQPGSQMPINFSDIPPGPYYLRLKNNTGQTFNSISIIRK